MHRILDFLNLRLWTSIWRVLVVGRKHETSVQRNGRYKVTCGISWAAKGETCAA